MNLNDELTVKIEKLSNLGFGIAKHEGLVIFVKNACPDDILKIKLTKLNKSWANGEIIEILTPSVHRVEPFCAMQKICGACQLQFIDYEYQLELKRQIVKDALKTIANLDIEIDTPIKSPEIKPYRYKIQYPVSSTKVSKRILAGYYKSKSHEIVNIKHCPVQPSVCDEIIEFIRNKSLEFNILGYDEKKHSGDLRHIVIRSSSSNNKNLVVLVINATKTFNKITKLANEIFNNFKEVSGVCINFNSKKTNIILGDKYELICGKDFIKERILDRTFKIGPNTFFQINPKSAENIFNYVKEQIPKNSILLDAYSGITTFGIILSDICKKVISVENNKQSVALAQELIKSDDIKNVELHNIDMEKFFQNEIRTKKRKFDITVLDPPRKGCDEKTLEHCLNLTTSKIIYVSCNPATLARDLKYLTSKGAKIEKIRAFDMFCHTYHIETVTIIDLKDVKF